MADVVCNISKGRWAEFFNRVDQNDPAASVITISLWQYHASFPTDDSIRDADTFAAIDVLANTTEATFTNYARIQLVDTDIATLSPDDSGNLLAVDIADQVWTSAGGASNNTLGALIVGYDYLGTDVNANIVPIGKWDFSITTNGSNLQATINASGLLSAS